MYCTKEHEVRPIVSIKSNQIKNPHKTTHGQGEADPSATPRVANPASQATQAWGAVRLNSSSESRDLG